MKKIIIAIACLSILGACSVSEAEKMEKAIVKQNKMETEKIAMLQENGFDFMEYIIDEEYALLGSDYKEPMTITFSEDKIHGFGGINNFTTDYTIENGELIVNREIAATRKAGPNHLMEAEYNYMQNIAEANRLTFLSNGHLILTTPDGEELEFFKRINF